MKPVFLFAAAAMLAPSVVRADSPAVLAPPIAQPIAIAHERLLPPWTDADDVPLPTWARTVAPKRAETIVVASPGKSDARRGTTLPGVRLPLYAAKRAAGCSGRWLLVGPMAWICGDAADVTADEPYAPQIRQGEGGLPFRYFFVGRDGAYGFLNLDRALEDAPDQELEQGFGVAIAEERDAHGEPWGLTRHGKWIALRTLRPVRGSEFHGEELRDAASPVALDFGWITSDVAYVYSAPKPSGKPLAVKKRFARVAWREEKVLPASGGVMVRISADGETPAQWMRARDLAHPTLSTPPNEIGGGATTERWIDVDLASQTLVAYEGAAPVYATLVSTGKGATGSETATPPGVHRLWVKLTTTDMDNLKGDGADGDSEEHYSIEDVPYVQFFDKAIALHAAFWHEDFGRTHSHGCVNLAPKDAAWLFGFTSPHLPAGWSAVLPSALDRGTAIRVH